MKKIFILGRDKVGWSIDRDRQHIKRFLEYNNDVKIVNNIFTADVIYCVWYRVLLSKKYNSLIKIFKKLNNMKIVAHITNDIIFHPGNLKDYRELKNLVDIWVSPSKRVHQFIENDGQKSELIPFYVNPTIFKKETLCSERKELCRILKIDYEEVKDRYLIGSFQRDSEGYNLMKPKWQKNPGLLIDILKELPKDKILLILAGPRRHWIRSRCKKWGIPYKMVGEETSEEDIFINNLKSEKINLLYNLIDLYIVSSASEGGPKAILEAGLTRTLIYSTDVGFAEDMIHEDLLFKYKEEVIRKIVKNIKNRYFTKQRNKEYISYNYEKIILKLNIIKMKENYQEVIGNV